MRVTVLLLLVVMAVLTGCNPRGEASLPTVATSIQSVHLEIRGSYMWQEIRFTDTSPKDFIARYGDLFYVGRLPYWGGSFEGGFSGLWALEERGAFQIYLPRKGYWERYSLDYSFLPGADGVPVFRVESRLRGEVLRNEEVPIFTYPFYDEGVKRELTAYVFTDMRAPLSVSPILCLQEGAPWPFGDRPTNTSPYFPPVAPEAPPALYFGAINNLGETAVIEYDNGRYVMAIDPARLHEGVQNAYAPQDSPVKVVFFAGYYDPKIPQYRRWVRIYPENPLTFRLEGGRLVCDPNRWVFEPMPEGFVFPGFDEARRTFDMRYVPNPLPPELDPYAGR